MHTHRHRRHLIAAFVLIAGGVVLPGPLGQALSDRPAAAQSPARPPAPDRPAAAQSPARPATAVRPAPAPPNAAKPGEVASDPIRCWWKTDRTAVTVGERFVLVLTCGVIEAGRTTVVPNTSQLEGGAIQITPFEVVSAVRREDVVASPWRYLQFEYSVRVLNDGFFGQDVNIPALTVTYNVQAPGGGTQGRDQSYILPALPMRVLSLVPKSATDIRDASDQTFAAVESGRFRALAARVAAWISLVFAAAFALLTGLRLAGRFRKRDAVTVPPIPATALLGGCLQALQTLKSEVSSAGWSAESARRALTVLRIAGASALDRRVTQKVVDRATAEREGQLVVRTGWLRRGRTMVSAPTTSPSITSSLLNGHAPAARTRVSLEQIGGSLHALNNAAYGRGEPPDSSNLDEALGEGIEAVRRLRASSRWPMRTFEAVSRSMFGM